MEEKKMTFKDFVTKAKEKAISYGRSFVYWAKENPAEAAALASGAAFAINKGTKLLRLREEKIHRERDFYDKRLGAYSRASRRPTTWERREIDRRYKAGDTYFEILDDLGLNSRR